MRSTGNQTRQKLFNEAMRLFTQKPYADVTFTELENATGLSRGAIMYHIGSKEKLFRESVNTFVFNNSSVRSIPDPERCSLYDAIDSFLNILGRHQRHWKREGINNINYALFNMQLSAYNLIPETLVDAAKWYEDECEVWKNILTRAIESGEIKKIEPEVAAHLIEDTYLGTAFAGIAARNGYDLRDLRRQLLLIYQLLKK
jgi:AcrR family transcriptional regulator